MIIRFKIFRMAASVASSNVGNSSSFKAYLGNEEISMEIDTEKCQLKIAVANASHFVVHRKTISKSEEVKALTGTHFFGKSHSITVVNFIVFLCCRRHPRLIF